MKRLIRKRNFALAKRVFIKSGKIVMVDTFWRSIMMLLRVDCYIATRAVRKVPVKNKHYFLIHKRVTRPFFVYLKYFISDMI